MKILFIIPSLLLLFFSCNKDQISNNIEEGQAGQTSLEAMINKILADSLPKQDFRNIDLARVVRSKVTDDGEFFIRIGFKGQRLSTDFVLLRFDSASMMMEGRIIHWEHPRNVIRSETKCSTWFVISSLSRSIVHSREVIDGRWKNKHSAADQKMAPIEEEPAGEQTLPPVVITSYYPGGETMNWFWYQGFFDIDVGSGDSHLYGSSEPYETGGGGSSYDIIVDYDEPLAADEIDLKAYLDCFGSKQQEGATYTITIATDIPVNGDPSVFFNWSEGFPGHTYLEFYKNDDVAGLIQQNIGFYPKASWKASTGGSIPSKIVDNAQHEYNARYTIAVTATQFQAALDAAKNGASGNYNIATYNCTDFALNVFNAAGGNLTIPRHTIPGFENGTAKSNTPQGLYERLNQMSNAGNPQVQMPGIKGYGGSSHGPCH